MNTSILRNSMLPLLAALGLALAGCGDRLPTESDGLPAEKIYFSAAEMTTTGVSSMATYSIDPDGSNKKLVIAAAALGSAPRAGKMAYWRRLKTATMSIYKALIGNIDGTGGLELASGDDNAGAVNTPVLSPDGKKVAYSAHPTDLFIVNADGTGRVRISSNAAYETGPAFSPDGTRLAFYGDDSLLYMVSVNGGTPVRIGDSARDHHDGYSVLTWSPAGDRLAYNRRNASGGTDIAIADLRGGVTVVTESASVNPATAWGFPAMPAWSPAGDRIAFVSDSGALITVAPNGTGRRVLVDAGVGREQFPQWSSDGSKMVFTYCDDAAGLPDGIGTLKMVDVASGRVTTLASFVFRGFWVR